MNNFNYKLGLGLAGVLKSKKKKYKGNKRAFNYTQVFITISEYNKKFSYDVKCLCNEVSFQGFGSSPFKTIFTKKGFKSQMEAESSIQKQVRFAQKKFNESEFYLNKQIEIFKDGNLLKDISADHKFKNQKWIIIDPINLNFICRNCANINDEKTQICKYCGEPII